MLSIFLQGARQSIRICTKTGTHTKNKAPLLVTILFIKVEGVLTENYLRIRFYHSLERILTILRYRFQINTDPDSPFHPYRIRITVTVPAQFFSPTFKKILFLLIFFVYFCRIFAGKVTNYLLKTRVNSTFFSVLSRVKSSTSGSSATLCPREPNPFRSTGEKAW